MLTCPNDQTVVGDSKCEIILLDYTGMATISDNCDTNPTVLQSPVAGTVLSGTTPHTITITVTDAAGNSSDCSFELTIEDTISPIVTCLPNQVEFLDEYCEFSLPDYGLNMVSEDNCDESLFITQTPESGTAYKGKQNLSITVTFEDASGNKTSCTFMVDVKTDKLNPGCLDDLVVTTLLTPNGDGKNDNWIINDLDYVKDCTVMIFNRWGQKVYESTGYNNDWNGTMNGNPLPDGAYYYVVKCQDVITYQGPITILR